MDTYRIPSIATINFNQDTTQNIKSGNLKPRATFMGGPILAPMRTYF